MTAPAKILLAAGGTGGHLFPAEALAAVLAGRGFSVALATDRRGAGYRSDSGMEIHELAGAGISGKNLGARLAGLAKLACATLQARRLVARIAPSAVVGFGGYASVAPVLAASRARIPTLIHEQNAVMGRANRFLAPRVDAIATAFDVPDGGAAKTKRPPVVTGNPVRAEIPALTKTPYAAAAEDAPLRILILGGSQGARILGQNLPAAIANLAEPLRRRLVIAHQCRAEDSDAARATYTEAGIAAEIAAFFDDVPRRLAAAHLVIARAGASTIAELTVAGRPALLIPFAGAVDDHQSANARVLANAGGAWLVSENAATPKSLTERLAALLNDPAGLARAAAAARGLGRPDAAARLGDLVAGLVPSNGNGGRTADIAPAAPRREKAA